MKLATEHPHTIGQPHLIPPATRDYFRIPGDMDIIRERTSKLPPEWERDPEWLPLVRCIGVFQSDALSSESMDASCLTVVWYQDEFVMPIAPSIMAELQSLGWDALASDVEL